MTVKSKVLLIFIVVMINWLVASEENVVKSEKDKQSANKNITSAPVSVDSRFFDLGQLFRPHFSNQNQNPPFPPTAQGNLEGSNPGNAWGNPNQQPQNQGYNPQGPNGPNQWQSPQLSNPGGTQNPNYPNNFNNYPQSPNQQVLNGPNQWQNPQAHDGNQYPTYPNDPNYQFPGNNQNTNWRPEYTDQGSIPTQGGSNGPTQIQPPNQGQEWSEPRPNPDQNRPIRFPDQDYQRPNNGLNNYPYNNNQNPGQDPNQSWQNSSGGTLDDILTPTNNGSGNAILGKPVVVPTTTVNPDEIFFNNSSESPLQRQCVQDCPATPEYNPICGTNNVTYFNPGKFVCARNCGVSVYVARRGVCVRRPM